MSASTSPLPYTGNKSCIVNTILSVMPKHTVYIDPCMGSAEVFFRKPRAEKEILNDYNGDLVNLFRVIQNNEKLAYLLGRLYLSINGELAFKQNKDRLKGVPNILDDVIETSQIFYDASWEDIQNAAAFLENQVYSFSSTGQTFGIARRDMSQRLPRLMSAYRNMHPLYPVQSKKNSPPPMKGTKRYRKEQKRAAKKARRQSIAHVLTLIENLDTQARVARSM